MRRGIAKVGIITASVASVGVGGGAAVNAWILEPQRANQAHRVEYDAQGHTLSGDGIVIRSEPFSTIPDADFENIPTYGGDDKNFNNPRRVTLSDSDTCKDLTVEGGIQGKQIVAAVSQTSPYQADHFYVAPKGNNEFNLCLVEKLDTSKNTDSVDVAIQLK